MDWRAIAAAKYRWDDWLLGTAGAYLALAPTNALTFPRSVFFATAAVLALLLLLRAALRLGPGYAPPPRAVAWTFGLWCLWSTASLLWSVDPAFSAGHWRREIGWTLLTVVVFHVATRDARAWRRLVATALASFVVLALAALVYAASARDWNASIWHGGVGPWSTFVVIIAPFCLALLAPAPAGFANGRRSVALGAALLVLLLASARTSDNRMVWIALAVSFAFASALGGWRWHGSLRRAPLRWLLPGACVLIALGALFASTAREKAQLNFSPQTSVTEALAADPRPHLWSHTLERIRERPWTGFGLGRAIIGDEMRQALHDPLMSHAHNVFMSQWLQTGLPGLGLFVALLVALAGAYAAAYRSSDDARASVGVIGLALVAGFVVKNLTDDFLFGANAKEFWALNTMLLAFDAQLCRRPPVAAAG